MISFGNILTPDCLTSPAPLDPRCSDPAFALANPTICPVQPKLIIKPGVALTCALGSIQFKAFYTRNGVEQDVTAHTIWTSGDLDIALIGAISGNCTGIAAGDVQITATYQGLTATAQLTVFASAGDGASCCDQKRVAMLLAVDMSRSMSQQFDGTYATRLAFAKAAATRFISEVNTAKDTVGLLAFDGVTTTLLSAPVADKAAVGALVPSIAQGQQKTEFYDAVKSALATLNATTADERVLVLLSDGQDTLTSTFTQANDPIVLLSDFKNSGGIVICLGVRASDTGFALLSAMSTGGFFLNAYPGTAQDALDLLSGLKGYICAGNCTPAGDVVTYQGQVDYAAFQNWDVVGGTVDLCGNGFFDFLPGNGLYVDLGGTTAPTNGALTLKTPLAIVSGHTYRLTLRLAGNQRLDEGPISAQVRLYDAAIPGDLINQALVIADYTQDFATYSFSFTAQHDASGTISIQQNVTPQEPRIGLLLDQVTFEDTSTLVTLLSDNFDTENPQYVPPGCGVGTTYVFLSHVGHYGYMSGTEGCYGAGCLDTPPPAQLPDPHPLSDIESGYTPPKQYTSTKTACATCPQGALNLGVALIPVMTGYTTPSGVASASSEENYLGFQYRAWFAFQGQEDNASPVATQIWTADKAAGLPAWLQYQFAAPVTAATYLVSSPGWFPLDWTLQGSSNGSTWNTLDTQTAQNFAAGAGRQYTISTPTAYAYYRLLFTNFPSFVNGAAACSAFQLYGAATTQDCESASATSLVSQADADAQAAAAALAAATAKLHCQTVFSSTLQFTYRCPVGSYGQDVIRSASATSLVSQSDADAKALASVTAAATAAANCALSNNDQKITLLEGPPTTQTAATPYPSVKHVSGGPASIAKVTVTLKGLSHASIHDVFIVLRSPNGTYVNLMENTGAFCAVSDLTLVFDDAGAALPGSCVGYISGTYKPTQNAAASDLIGPAAPHPYQTTLAAFIGQNANGSWSLWCNCKLQGVTGQISDGWDLTIT